MTTHYILRFNTYSGMYYDMQCDDDLAVIRKAAASYIRDCRHSQPVHTLESGKRWEFETRPSAFMISDNDGTLTIVEVEQHDEEDDFDIELFNEAYEENYEE